MRHRTTTATNVTFSSRTTSSSVLVTTCPPTEGSFVTDDTCKTLIARSLSRHSHSSSTILKISLLTLLLAATSAFAIAPDHQSNRNTCGITDQDAAGLNGDLSTNIYALRDYSDTIAGLLKESKFKQLDCLANRFRSSKERFPGGAWKLHVLYQGLDNPVQYPQYPTEKDWNVLLRRLKQWVAVRPRSLTARVALASAYVDYAWHARGNGYVDTVRKVEASSSGNAPLKPGES